MFLGVGFGDIFSKSLTLCHSRESGNPVLGDISNVNFTILFGSSV